MERYNLRSKGQEICVPVQLQMAGDGELFTQDLGSSHPDPGQVTFQSNGASDSDSELDLSDIFKNSDNEINSPSKHGFQRGPDQQGHSGDGVACNKTVIDQNEINMQILKQLSHLGERLTNIEKKGGVCKKSSDKSKIQIRLDLHRRQLRLGRFPRVWVAFPTPHILHFPLPGK